MFYIETKLHLSISSQFAFGEIGNSTAQHRRGNWYLCATVVGRVS